MDTNVPATRSNGGLPSTHVNPAPQILASDIIVPYIVIGQGLSDAVVEKKVQLGDIYRTTTREIIGNPDKPIDAIFLHAPRADWVYEEKPKGATKFEFRRTEPRHAGNETLPWSFWADDDGNVVEAGTKGASEWRRVKRLTVFAILPRDVEAAQKEMAKAEAGELPDVSKALTPVVLSFRSSSYKAGKEVTSFYTQAASMKQEMWKYMVQAGTHLEQNDNGAFYVWDIDRTKAKAVPKDMLPLVQDWVAMIAKGADITVHEEGEVSASGTTAPREVNKKAAQDIC